MLSKSSFADSKAEHMWLRLEQQKQEQATSRRGRKLKKRTPKVKKGRSLILKGSEQARLTVTKTFGIAIFTKMSVMSEVSLSQLTKAVNQIMKRRTMKREMTETNLVVTSQHQTLTVIALTWTVMERHMRAEVDNSSSIQKTFTSSRHVCYPQQQPFNNLSLLCSNFQRKSQLTRQPLI